MLTKELKAVEQNTLFRNTYYTDEGQLYYIVQVHKSDSTVEVENCSTGFVHLHTMDYIKNWRRVVMEVS